MGRAGIAEQTGTKKKTTPTICISPAGRKNPKKSSVNKKPSRRFKRKVIARLVEDALVEQQGT